jgi:hypothetical protein
MGTRATWLLLASLAWAEVVDRVAVSLGRQVVTQSAIVEQIRVAAFLNGDPVDESALARRRMAERIIEQTLLRREMEASRFAMPTDADGRAMLDRLRRERFPDEAGFRAELGRRGLTEEALLRNFAFQLTTLRFVELRFRPSSAVSEGEIEIHYREVFVPEHERRQPTVPPPAIEDARDDIEQALLQAKIDQAMTAWLREAREQTRVVFFEGAFR